MLFVLSCRKREEKKEIILKKKEAFPSFGLSIFGGNKAGIFVDKVEMWTAAHEAELKAGSKIITVSEFFILFFILFCPVPFHLVAF